MARTRPSPPRSITLADPSWTNPRVLNVANIEVTWAVKQPGHLSCFVPVADAHRFGVDDWVGLWVYYEHPTQGPWGGVIADEPATLDDGALELSAADMTVDLLSGRAAPILSRPESGYAGALFRRALSLVQMTDPLPIDAIAADESGPPLEVEHRGDNLYALGAALAQQSGQEFELAVNADRTIDLLWREQLGTDTTVLLAEGYQVAGGRIDRSRVALVNEIIGLAANEDYARSSQARSESAASIERFRGRRQVVRRYDGVISPASVKARVLADLRREQDATYLPTVTMDALHPIAHDIRHGDRLRYWSHAKNRELDCRVLSRTVRDGTVLELALEGTEVRIPPRGNPTFTPDMLSGLVAWFDADDARTVTILDGGVWGVADKSNAGHDLGAAELIGSVLAPAYRPNTLNGRAVVDNDGQQEGLQRAAVDFSSTNAMTVYVVARETDTGGTSPVVTFGDLTGVSPGQWEIGRDASDNITATLRGNVGLSDCESTTAWGTADFHVVTAVFDMSLSTNEVTVFVDGAQAGIRNNNSNNTGSFDSSDTLSIPFTTISVHNLWQWAEVLIFDRAHTTTQHQAVWSYLDRWGV